GRDNLAPTRALAYFRLAEAQFRTQKNEAAIENAQKSVDLYLANGDFSGAGRAYWALANAYAQTRQFEKYNDAIHQALTYCQQAGDEYGIGNALNAMIIMEADITKAMRNSQQAIEAFQKAGYLDRIQIPKGNLSNSYLDLGLSTHAARLQREVLEVNHKMNAKIAFMYVLGNTVNTQIILGDFESAIANQKEFEAMAATLGDPNMEHQAQMNWSDFYFAKGDFKAALRHQKVALKLAQQHQMGGEVVVFTELGKLHLADKDPINALKATTKATDLHRAQNFSKQDSFTQQAIWWRHTQALLANKKNKEAQEALNRAYDFLLESIQNIRDEGLRRNALNKVPENRELIQYWVENGTKRSKGDSRVAPTKDRLFAYLQIESNLREPFQRLADSGLRLNTLKSTEAIQTFLVEEATELIGGERVMLILEKQTSEVLKTSEVYVANSILPRGEDANKVLKSINKYISQARLTRTVQLIKDRPSSKVNGLGRIIAPLIAQNQLLGYLYVDMDSIYGTFDNTDRDMLGMLANQGAVALDNAGLIAGLEQKVEERTAQLQEHISELQIINSIQQGLAAELDFQAIVDLVGDKLREVLNSGDIGIRWYDSKTNIITPLYEYEHNQRIYIAPAVPQKGGPFEKLQTTKKPLVFNTTEEQDVFGLSVAPGTDQSKSTVYIPIIVSDSVVGYIITENHEREYAYGESEIRLLTTIAASLGTALENARLFDETQRLLKITEDRAAELAIINSVSEGLVRELDFQAIIDLVGEKIRREFKVEDMYIALYDSKSNILTTPYYIEHSDRFPIEPREFRRASYAGWTITNRTTLVINENIEQRKLDIGIDASAFIGDDNEEDLTQSVVCAPIWSSGQIIGVITLYSNETNAFPESSVSLLTTLCANLGVALQNARLFDETQRLLKITEERNAELAIINSVQAALAAELNIQGIYEAVGDKIREIFQGKDVGIRIYDSVTKMEHFPYTYENGERIHIDSEPVGDVGFGPLIYRTKQTHILNENILEEAKKVGSYIISGTEMPRSQAMVPLIAGDQARGLIELVDMQREHAFSESDVRLLQTLASSMSIALENARLFDETQRLLKETETRAAELAILNSVGEAMAKTLDVKTVTYNVGDKIREIFNVEIVDILMFDLKTNMVQLTYSYAGKYFEDEPAWELTEGGLTTKIIQTRQSLLLKSAKEIEDHGAQAYVTSPSDEPDIESYMGVPIMVGEKILGVVDVQSVKANAFDESNLRLLQTLSANMGIAIENARLFDETQRLLKITEERNAELAIINSVQAALAAE
ncbi:MAG TPA: hypothetical protein DHW49_06005, partial [Anaerolineae bacterium]|nr:hypothetical protein [Anaerolineae bacterium]